MLDFLNEVLLIEDNEPDAYQMGISGKSGAKMKAPDGGKASMKGDFNALHPRYPKGHPQGGKFMPKGSKDQIQAIAKNTGQSVEKVAAAVGGKAPANKGKLSKFSGSAGAVGKAQKVLKNKDATPEQRAKAKASIQKAAMKMRGEAPVVAEKPKRGKISNKEIMARNAGTSAPAPSGSMSQGDQRIQRKKELTSKALLNPKGGKVAFNVLQSETARDKNFGGVSKSKEQAIAKSVARNAKKKEKNAVKENKTWIKSAINDLRSNAKRAKRKQELTSKAVVKGSKVAFNVLQSQAARDKNFGGTRKSTEKAINKSIARNAKKKEKSKTRNNKQWIKSAIADLRANSTGS